MGRTGAQQRIIDGNSVSRNGFPVEIPFLGGLKGVEATQFHFSMTGELSS